MDLLDLLHVKLIFLCRQWVLVHIKLILNICQLVVLAGFVCRATETGDIESLASYDCHVLRSEHIIICGQVSRLIPCLVLSTIRLYLVSLT